MISSTPTEKSPVVAVPLAVGEPIECKELDDPTLAVGDLLDDERVLEVAEFDPLVIKYWAMSLVVVLLLTIYGVPVLIFVPCITAIGFAKRFESLRLVLTDRSLVFKQGMYGGGCCCWNVVEKHIPLEKITNIDFSQGCIQRCYDVTSLRVQTAGQGTTTPELSVAGVKNAREFRRAVFRAKHGCGVEMGVEAKVNMETGERMIALPTATAFASTGQTGSGSSGGNAVGGASGGGNNGCELQPLLEVRDTLQRMERLMVDAVAAAAPNTTTAQAPADADGRGGSCGGGEQAYVGGDRRIEVGAQLGGGSMISTSGVQLL